MIDVDCGNTMFEIDPTPLELGRLKEAFGCFPSGVAAVCGLVDGEPAGMAASSFTSVSMNPPLVSVCIQQTSETWPRLRSLGTLGVSLLAEEHGRQCRKLAQKNGDRFEGVPWESTAGGSVFVAGASAWMDCSLHAEIPAGDHVIALLRVEALEAYPDVLPLVFHGSRFHRLVGNSIGLPPGDSASCGTLVTWPRGQFASDALVF